VEPTKRDTSARRVVGGIRPTQVGPTKPVTLKRAIHKIAASVDRVRGGLSEASAFAVDGPSVDGWSVRRRVRCGSSLGWWRVR
jgi:hypothetical protein